MKKKNKILQWFSSGRSAKEEIDIAIPKQPEETPSMKSTSQKQDWQLPPEMQGQSMPQTRLGEPKGIMRGLNGLYAGAEIDLKHGTIIIGRDANRANLVYDDSCTKVSRKHCEMSYDVQAKLFVIVDTSSNGTFKNENPNCLPQNMRINLEPGSIIDIGDESNRFILE